MRADLSDVLQFIFSNLDEWNVFHKYHFAFTHGLEYAIFIIGILFIMMFFIKIKKSFFV